MEPGTGNQYQLAHDAPTSVWGGRHQGNAVEHISFGVDMSPIAATCLSNPTNPDMPACRQCNRLAAGCVYSRVASHTVSFSLLHSICLIAHRYCFEVLDYGVGPCAGQGVCACPRPALSPDGDVQRGRAHVPAAWPHPSVSPMRIFVRETSAPGR